MAKLTDKDRERAKKELENRIEEAIMQSPRGLTDKELFGSVLKGSVKAGIIK